MEESTMKGRNGGTLRRAKKGEVLNPKGRPKKLPALDVLIAEVLADEQNGMSAAEAILKVIRGKAIKGDLKAAEMLLNRAYGKPKESIDHTTNGESINPTIIQFVDDGEDKQEISTTLEPEN